MSFIDTKDYFIEVIKGNITGADIIEKFGRNDAVGTSLVPVALGGVYQTPQAASATALRIKAGGNANDTAAGSGARQITLEGIDETGAFATETLATAGASASSATTTTFMRLYRAWVSQSGTYATATAGSHSADIVIENSGGGTDWATIDSTIFPNSQTEIGIYTVPSGKTADLISLTVHTDTNKTTDLLLFQRQSILDASAPYEAMRLVNTWKIKTQDGTPSNMRGGWSFPAGTDFGFMAKVDSGSAQVTVDFEILLLDA